MLEVHLQIWTFNTNLDERLLGFNGSDGSLKLNGPDLQSADRMAMVQSPAYKRTPLVTL